MKNPGYATALVSREERREKEIPVTSAQWHWPKHVDSDLQMKNSVQGERSELHSPSVDGIVETIVDHGTKQDRFIRGDTNEFHSL